MTYRGFREEALLQAAKELEALGLGPGAVYAAMNLAGAKWRSVQLREGRKYETHAEEDSRVFHAATESVMRSTMETTLKLSQLAHSSEGDRFMFLAISLTLARLFSRGPRSIRDWLKDGDVESRKVILAFAIGSSIIVEESSIDYFFRRILEFRFGVGFESLKDETARILEVVGRLGQAGYAILNPANRGES